MAREALVDECVVRVQKVHDAAIFAYRAPDEQLRLTLEPLDQAQVVIRITVLIDHNFLDATQVQPLTCKVIHKRIDGARVGQHSPHFFLESLWIAELTALGKVEQSLVRNAAPQEEGQARRDLDVAEAIDRLTLFCISMDPQQEIRIDQKTFEGELNARVKTSAVPAAVVEKLDQRLNVLGGQRPAISQPRHSRKNLSRASVFFGSLARIADENRAAAGGVFRSSARREGSADLYSADIGIIHVDLVVRNDAASLQRLREAFGFPELSHEVDANRMRAGFDRDTDLQPGISSDLHVLFPGIIAGESRFAITGIAGCCRSTLPFASDSEPLQQRSIEADVQLLRPSHTLDVILILPLQTDFDQVLAIDGEVIVDRHSAARSEGQVFALPVVLQNVKRDLESVNRRIARGKACRQPRHLAGHGQVTFQVCS